jgi:membrane protease YdiL (CAAX protease family)
MNIFDDNPPSQPDDNLDPQSSASPPPESPSGEPQTVLLAGDPLSYAAVTPTGAQTQHLNLPEDLRISWSWLHLICFIIFSFITLIVVQTVFAIHYAPRHPLPEKQLEQYLLSKPEFTVGSNVISFALIFLFLYVTLSVLPGEPFWRSLGWRKLKTGQSSLPDKPWIYFFSGCALSLFTAWAGSRVHTPDDMPIELLLKSRTGAFLMMGMAVLIAPLVEETVFRGYLYPLFAKWLGVVPSVVVTGVLFGLMHGAQLAWTWGIVSMLILVGIVFTYVRARTGTVFASYLMHLGYNSLIAIASIVGTHGFTKMTPGP